MFFGKRKKKKSESSFEDEYDDDFGFEEDSEAESGTRRRRAARDTPPPDDDSLAPPPRRRRPPRTRDDDDESRLDPAPAEPLGRSQDDATFVEGPPPEGDRDDRTPPARVDIPPPRLASNVDDADVARPDATVFIGRPVDHNVLFIGWLVATAGPNRGRDYRLSDGATKVGKAPECQIRLPGDAYVSSLHATIVHEGDDYVLRDPGSTNGTFCNDERISEVRLRDGDRVRFGLSDFVFKSCRLE